MQQKTFLAIALSLVVLFGYEVFFIAPKRAEMAKNSQTSVNKEVVIGSTISTNALPSNENISLKPTATKIKEEIKEIKTPGSTINLSNVGGSLHKVSFNEAEDVPARNFLTVKGYENTPFVLRPGDGQKVTYEFVEGNTRIVKTFEKLDEHTIKAEIEISNLNKMSNLENITFNALTVNSSKSKDVMLEEYSIFSGDKVFRKANAGHFTTKEEKSVNASLKWVGFRSHYHNIVIHPDFKTKSYEIKMVNADTLNISFMPETVVLAPGQTGKYEFTIYQGPQNISLMKKYGKDFDKIVAFFNWGPIDYMAKAIYWTILFVQSIVKSWGFTIILISIIIYGLTYPLTFKSMMSMRKMQAMQPKINALKEKHKNDPAKVQAEMLDIYRREKINPLGGCLPMLLQMPIFIALYQVLWRSYFFQGKSFLWIKDLTQPDRLFIFPFHLPFLGNEFNILPILMAIVMFAQQKLSAKSMVVTDEAQVMQQKMMTMIFPVFIGFIFYKFASGLSLYFMMFYLFSALTQWKMLKVKV